MLPVDILKPLRDWWKRTADRSGQDVPAPRAGPLFAAIRATPLQRRQISRLFKRPRGKPGSPTGQRCTRLRAQFCKPHPVLEAAVGYPRHSAFWGIVKLTTTARLCQRAKTGMIAGSGQPPR